LPLTSLNGLENHKVSWSATGFDFIKTALQTLMPHVFIRKTAHTFARHAVRSFALSKAKYPAAEWITSMSPDPGVIAITKSKGHQT